MQSRVACTWCRAIATRGRSWPRCGTGRSHTACRMDRLSWSASENRTELAVFMILPKLARLFPMPETSSRPRWPHRCWLWLETYLQRSTSSGAAPGQRPSGWLHSASSSRWRPACSPTRRSFPATTTTFWRLRSRRRSRLPIRQSKRKVLLQHRRQRQQQVPQTLQHRLRVPSSITHLKH